MRSLARPALAAAGGWPALAVAQAGGAAAQTGQSAWNWVIGIAALIVVIALARLFFGRRRPARGTGG